MKMYVNVKLKKGQCLTNEKCTQKKLKTHK